MTSAVAIIIRKRNRIVQVALLFVFNLGCFCVEYDFLEIVTVLKLINAHFLVLE